METGKRTKVLLKDPSYSAEESSDKYHLSIQFGLYELGIAVLDITSNKYLCLEQISLQKDTDYSTLTQYLETAIASSELLQHAYKSADGVYLGQHSTLVPNALFDVDQRSKYLDFNFSELPTGTIKTDALFSIGTTNIYLIPEGSTKLLKQQFPNIKIHHSTTVLIESLMRQNRHSSALQLYVNINTHNFEVVALEGKSLKFYNSFDHKSAEDLVYYLLYVMEQLELGTAETTVTLLGEVHKESPTYHYLKKYVSNLSFGKRNWVFKYPYAFSPIAEHQSFVLLHQYQCA